MEAKRKAGWRPWRPPKQRNARWRWTGFTGKTLWDWLQLLSALAIPVVLAYSDPSSAGALHCVRFFSLRYIMSSTMGDFPTNKGLLTFDAQLLSKMVRALG